MEDRAALTRVEELYQATKSLEFYILVAVLLTHEGGSDSRAWMAFLSVEEAEKTLRENPDWFLEDGSYNYVIIEKHEMGVPSLGDPGAVWLSATFDGNNYTITRCDCPKELEGIVNWGLG